jgi:hypothetical protein
MELQLILNEGNVITKLNIENINIQKMLFIFNALENGWSVEKNNETYKFKKKHEEKTEYFLDSYLKEFISTHLNFLK